jgi:hypothetical protein
MINKAPLIVLLEEICRSTCAGMPIPVAARPKACLCGISLAGIAGSNFAGDTDISVLWLLCVTCV